MDLVIVAVDETRSSDIDIMRKVVVSLEVKESVRVSAPSFGLQLEYSVVKVHFFVA